MYTEELYLKILRKELRSEIRRYFSEEKCSESIILNVLNDAESIINEKSIKTACQAIIKYVEFPDKNGKPLYPQKTRLPYWIKLLVFVKIYQILNGPDCPIGQSDLLKDMGLPSDIFREKHWDMYSPDLKVRQNNYENIHFPFAHAEVESNEIFRAMIHHMVKYSKVYTDTFVDMFGKLGIIPLFCAKGYSHREIWLNTERNYKIMMIFKKAMQKPMKVIKRIKKVQRDLLRTNNNDERAAELYRYLGFAAAMSLTISGLDFQTIKLIYKGKDSPSFDIYDFAAYYIIQNIITPGYWEDKNLTVIKDGEKPHIKATLKNISTREIVKFAKISFDCDTKASDGIQEKDAAGIQRYAKALNKKACAIGYVDVKKYLEYSHNMRALLYIDPPKYLREEKRFQFGYDDYCNLFEMLNVYEGDWILVWKNYVEISPSRASQSIYSGLHTQDRIEQDDDWIEEDDGSPPKPCQNQMSTLYAMLEAINKQRSIHVFRFHNSDPKHPNSVLFFTTIDFLNIGVEEFERKYGVIHTTDGDYKNDPVLEKIPYNIFYLNSIKVKGVL